MFPMYNFKTSYGWVESSAYSNAVRRPCMAQWRHGPEVLSSMFSPLLSIPFLPNKKKSHIVWAPLQVRSGAFTADGTELLTSGGDGTVYVWDLRMQRCSQRYVDEGCINGTALACSPDGGMFATGERAWVTCLT